MSASSARSAVGHTLSDSKRARARAIISKPHRHAVQFYESDEYLVNLVTEFVAAGLRHRHPAVIIATEAHRHGFLAGLSGRGIDVKAVRESGDLTLLDARETLDLFMWDGMPDRAAFKASVGRTAERLVRHAGDGHLRAYGEMVNLLWEDGNPAGAVALEELWNELGNELDFSLLCAYAMTNFSDAGHGTQFERICATHTHVLPMDRLIADDDGSQFVEMAILQQRAQALETEVRRREEIERQLRTTVTQLSDREAELNRAAEERERSLQRERTARAEAERAKATAEHANRAKSQFLAVMSHELRTPLNAIGGYAELMEMEIHGPVSYEQRDALDRIQRSQRHLLGLINQVLNYARIETGSLRYHISEFSFDDLLRTVEALASPQVASRGLVYACSPSNPPVMVRADREKVQQILLNLLNNASKFTGAGGRVALECRTAGREVLVRVTDTGIGISPEKLDVIFEPFVQVDTNYTRTRDGVGLGLAISRDLARGMGGDLTVESTPGVGSAFTLALPRAG
jgi:signal transduction histidine kinase